MNDEKTKVPEAGDTDPADSQPEAQDKPKPELPVEEAGKPEELTPEELRLMADTMPGDGPGDD